MNKERNAQFSSESAHEILSLALPSSLSHERRDKLAQRFLLDCKSDTKQFIDHFSASLESTKNNWFEWQNALKAWQQFAENLPDDDATRQNALLILSGAHSLLTEQVIHHQIGWQEAVRNRMVDSQLIVSDKDDQMNMLVHDLRNPLSAINLNLRLLNLSIEASSPDRSIELIERLTRNTNSLQQLIQRLYEDNAKVDEGLSLSIAPADVNQIVAEALERCAVHAANKLIQLDLVQASVPAFANVDRLMLIQSIENLISNAIKFSSPNTSVRVTVQGDDDAITIDIRDEGQGLSADDLEKIFGRYQKLSATPAAGESSTGLGLYIVQKLIAAMDGKISAESPGKDLGATFCITLNRATPST